MYLHLGDELVIPTHDLVGIFDLDIVTVTPIGRAFLQQAERIGRLIAVGENLPKSFIVCGKHRDETVYISPISASTLLKRLSRGIDPGADILSEV